MNKSRLALSFVVLCTTSLQSQTLFNGAPGIDLLDAANWSNGLPGPGNDGTIGINGSFETGTVEDWGNVTINSGAVVDRIDGNTISLGNATSFTVAEGTLMTDPGTGNGKSNLNLNDSSNLTMTSPTSVVIAQNNIAVKDGAVLTMNDGTLTISGQKLNTDGVVNLVGGDASIEELFDGGTDGIVNLTDTQITVPDPAEDAETLTVFKTIDPWTFNFISGGIGSITIVGRDDTTAIEELIAAGYFFAIDGVYDDDPSSYSLTYDGSDTVFGLTAGNEDAPIRITATEFDTSSRTFSLTWGSVAGATYTVWESADLAPGGWTTLDNAVAGQDPTTTYPVSGLPEGQTSRFYRVSRNP